MLSRLLLALLATELTVYLLTGVVLYRVAGIPPGWLLLLAGMLALSGRTAYVLWCYRLSARLAPHPESWPHLRTALRLRLIAGETLALIRTHSLWQPFLPLLRPLIPCGGPGTPGPPVLFIHGYCCNEGFWAPLRRRLYRDGIRNQFGVTLEPLFVGIDELAEPLGERIEAICRQTGQDRVIAVAHSMGGLVARAYLHRHGTALLAHLITVGTPHAGTAMARIGPGLNARQMRPDSGWLQRLATPVDGVPCTTVCSVHDELVAPPAHATLPMARPVTLRGLGHVALGHSNAVREIIRAVARPG